MNLRILLLSVVLLPVAAFSFDSKETPAPTPAPSVNACENMNMPVTPADLPKPPDCCYWNIQYELSYEIPVPWHWLPVERLICVQPE